MQSSYAGHNKKKEQKTYDSAIDVSMLQVFEENSTTFPVFIVLMKKHTL